MLDLIPNTIIQIFLGESDKIEDFQTFRKNKILWKQYCIDKGFRYYFFDKDNIDEYLGEYKEFYYSMRYTWNRIDFIRYLILNKLGGIYIDLDIEPDIDRDLFDLLKDRIILNKWYDPVRCKWELNNALMGIRPGQFNDLIDYSVNEYKSKEKMKIYNTWKIRFMLHTTGVRAFKRWAKKQKYDYTESIHEYVTDEMTATWLDSFH